jgi:hypothetical protein
LDLLALAALVVNALLDEYNMISLGFLGLFFSMIHLRPSDLGHHAELPPYRCGWTVVKGYPAMPKIALFVLKMETLGGTACSWCCCSTWGNSAW